MNNETLQSSYLHVVVATTTWRYDDWRVSLFMDRTGHTEQYYGEKGDPFITANLSVGYNYSADLSLRATIANIEDKMPEKDSALSFSGILSSMLAIVALKDKSAE